MRILRPGLVAIQYIGVIATLFRGAIENKKYITVEPNDIVLVDEVQAITYCRGTQWKKIDTDVDLSSLLEKDNEPIKDELTLENIYNKTDDEIKEECKKRGIKIGRKKRDDLISLLLPFLEKEDTD